jgi:chromatin remodeling complex protein RSC6
MEYRLGFTYLLSYCLASLSQALYQSYWVKDLERDEGMESLAADIKALHRDVRKIRQLLEDPTGEKAEKRSQNNGFKKPIQVSAQLSEFLGVAAGTLVSRADVTQAINKYATEHNLKQGQKINLDDKLRTLLNPPEGFEMTFLKLQHFLKPHYLAPVAASEVQEPEKPKKPRVRKAAA